MPSSRSLLRIAAIALPLLLIGLSISPTRASPSRIPDADPVLYYELNPIAVNLTGTEAVSYYIETNGTVTSARLRKSGLPDIWLTQVGTRYSTTLTHARVVDGYGATSYNINFIGFLDVYQGSTPTTYNVNIGIVDSNIPHNALSYKWVVLPSIVVAQYTPHMVNLQISGLTPGTQDYTTVAQQFYSHFGDDYDFLGTIFIPEENTNRYHVVVRNSVSGIGLSLSNNSATYGSAGRLKGINVYPLVTYFDLGESSSIHEIGHQWINYLNMTQLQNVTTHWPISTLAYGIMGFNLPDGAGGDFPWQLVQQNSTTWLCSPRSPALTYNEMEMYLMGLIPPSQVPTNYSFTNQSQMCTDGGTLSGPVTTITAQNVIDQYGPRSPNYLSSQKKFNMASIVATRNRWLSNTEMDFLDYMAARGGAMVPLTYHQGLAYGMTYPFYLATKGKACLVTAINPTSSMGCYSTNLPMITK